MRNSFYDGESANHGSMSQTNDFIKLRNRIQISYCEMGSETGIPLILLHGLADSWHIYELLMPYLPESLHVYAVTQRGHGDSSCPDSGYRTVDFEGDLLLFMDALHIEKAVLLGASSGGFTARSFAVNHPERTMALVLIGSPASLRGIPIVEEIWHSHISKLTDPVSSDFVKLFAMSTFSKMVPQAFVDLMLQEYYKLPARVWRETTEGILQEDFPGLLGEIRCPALIIWGDHDKILNKRSQAALAKAIPGSRLVVLKGAGHMLHCEDPEGVASEITGFLEKKQK